MIFTLALTILAHLFTPYATVSSEVMAPCEDANPGAVCVMFDQYQGTGPDRWILTDTDDTFAYPTGLCTDIPAPCLLGVTGGWVLVSTVDTPVRDITLGA